VIGRADLITDPRYLTFADRLKHRELLITQLNAAFAARPTAEWIAELTAAGVPCAPVNSVADALADPQCAARGSVVETDHPRFGTVRAPASPVRVGDRARPAIRAPRHGEHTRAVLTEVAGYDRARIDALLAAGVIHQATP
jgi:crotonobetainyl-CoA:carnitine CoA-transferase CaiB-like acyl-CoA transferase